MNSIYNFSAGPAMIPKDVLCKAQKELKNWNNLRCSIMEISHRTQEFLSGCYRGGKRFKRLIKHT